MEILAYPLPVLALFIHVNNSLDNI